MESKILCFYCLHAFRIVEILQRHIKEWFKINGKQMMKIHLFTIGVKAILDITS